MAREFLSSNAPVAALTATARVRVRILSGICSCQEGQSKVRATLYYNNRHIAPNTPGRTESLGKYCNSTDVCLAVAFTIVNCNVRKSHCSFCSDCKGDFMSHDQTAHSRAIMSAALCDEESNRITESLEQYLASLKKERKFGQLRPGCQCLSRGILQVNASEREDISSVSCLMANFPVFSKAIAEVILKIISQ